MNPDVPQHGRSFRAAWLYYFHDKLRPGESERFTTERVGFTETVNLPTNDPEKAWRWMAYTALHQQEIKRAAGVDLRGRKMERPLYSYSLNWHPSQDPTQEQMREAAFDSLRTMGLEEYEAIIVAHTDREHPHVHLLVNKIHPATGKGAKLSNDYRQLQKWAYEYEKRHGKIFCRRREFNIIAKPEPIPSDLFVSTEPTQAPLAEAFQNAAPEIQVGSAPAPREDNGKRSKADQGNAAREEIRQELRAAWNAMRNRQSREIDEMERMSETAWGRMRYWFRRSCLKQPALPRLSSGLLAGAFNALARPQTLREDLRKTHEQERREFVRTYRIVRTADRLHELGT